MNGWQGVHPALTLPGLLKYGYMLLRDDLLPPHLTHGPGVFPASPCPCCRT